MTMMLVQLLQKSILGIQLDTETILSKIQISSKQTFNTSFLLTFNQIIWLVSANCSWCNSKIAFLLFYPLQVARTFRNPASAVF